MPLAQRARPAHRIRRWRPGPAGAPGRLPDFVIIGAMKCGTTSLFEYLRLHPDVAMPDGKELDFFVAHRNWKRGTAWYRAQFAHMTEPAVGESSPNYTMRQHFGGVAERMAQVTPDAKLIYVVRDPISRILSQFVHEVAAGREDRALSEVVADDPESNRYVLTSRYAWQLEEFAEHFPIEQLLVVSFERLVTDPASVMAETYAFVGVDHTFTHAAFGAVHNDSSVKRQPTRLGRRLGRKGRSALARVAPQLAWAPITRPQLDEAGQAGLRDVLAPDVAALRELTGQAFAEWSL